MQIKLHTDIYLTLTITIPDKSVTSFRVSPIVHVPHVNMHVYSKYNFSIVCVNTDL